MMINRREAVTGGLAILGSLAVPAARAIAADSAAPEVLTSNGWVRGYRDDGVNVFKGVRYGADTGPRRFMPPLPPERWDGIMDAFEYGPSSPQDRTDEPTSEDCLFLNVWTPGVDDNRHRPVMFYIHGGAYSHGSGSSPWYDGRHLAQRGDVVVVTVNHRLNAFGYLYLGGASGEAFADSGNCGQLDLVLALQWVRENIANFGGDPDRVLAFGQSGGGAKVATMMAMPRAAGLFQRAASMSGQQVTASGPGNAMLRTEAYLDSIDMTPFDGAALQELPAELLVEALSTPDPVLPYGSVYFGPVLDMRSLLRHPFYPDAPPQSAGIPMIIGNTHDETRAFLRDEKYYDLTWEQLPGELVPNMRVDIEPNYVVATYRRLYPDMSPSDMFFKITTASRSWRAAIIEAEERAAQDGAPTFVYQLDFQNPVQPELGAPHTLDIPLVFGNLDAPRSIAGTGPDSVAVSTMMSDAFIAFARSGDPNNAALPEWLPYTLESRETMIIDQPPRLESDPRGAERQLFATVPYVQPGT